MMKAISLWQPWATLWVLQIKKFETRNWPFPHWYTESVAIHAAKKKVDLFETVPDWQIDGIYKALEMAGLEYPEDLTFGAFIGVCDRIKSRQITKYIEDDLETDLGDWSLRRYYWAPDNMRELQDPIPFRGHQRIFNVEDHIILGGRPKETHQQIGLWK